MNAAIGMALNPLATMPGLAIPAMDAWFNRQFRAAPGRRGAGGAARLRMPADASEWIEFKEKAFKALLIVAPLFVFLMILAWDWLPFNAPEGGEQVAPEVQRLLAMDEDEMRALVWPTSAEAIEAAQPEFGGRPVGDMVRADFARCGAGSRFTCVVDGDSFRYKGELVRIADIDAPEVARPRCAREIEIGERATARLIALLNAGPLTLRATNTEYDEFGHRLLMVTRNGKSLGAELVGEGLAGRRGGPRIDWCSR